MPGVRRGAGAPTDCSGAAIQRLGLVCERLSRQEQRRGSLDPGGEEDGDEGCAGEQFACDASHRDERVDELSLPVHGALSRSAKPRIEPIPIPSTIELH